MNALLVLAGLIVVAMTAAASTVLTHWLIVHRSAPASPRASRRTPHLVPAPAHPEPRMLPGRVTPPRTDTAVMPPIAPSSLARRGRG